MSFDKMLAFKFDDLKILVDFCQNLGRNSKNNHTEKIIEEIQNLKNFKIEDFIKKDIKDKIFTKKSPIHYRWIIPDE